MLKSTNIPADQERRMIEEVQRWASEHTTASDLLTNLRRSVVYEDHQKLAKASSDAREQYIAARRALKEYRHAQTQSE